MSESAGDRAKPQAPKGSPWAALLPVAVFAGLAALFIFGLTEQDPSRVPSVLIDKPVPEFALPPLEGLQVDGKPVPGLAAADLKDGRPSVVNVWASWCVPCRAEHPQLVTMSQIPGLRLVGINYKDDPENARRFLGALGQPFAAIGSDRNGRTSVDWGVYGVPETYLIDGTGTIRYKHIGPISPQALENELMPKIRTIMGG